MQKGGKVSVYHAEVINLSLKETKLIQQFQILKVKKRFLGCVKIVTLSIPSQEIKEAVKLFQENMSTKLNKEWYITFHNAERVIIVFREKIFDLSGKGMKPIYQKSLDVSMAEDKDKWNEMITYAKSLGIPEEQCDFLPEDFREQKYD
jgi:hypothetical protein